MWQLVLVAFVCPVLSTAACADGDSCMNLDDHTSLMQVKKIVKMGNDRNSDAGPMKDSPKTSKEAAEASAVAATKKDDAEEIPAELSSEGEQQQKENFQHKESERRQKDEEDVIIGENEEGDEVCMNTKYIRLGAGDYFFRANAMQSSLGAYGDFHSGMFSSNTMEFLNKAGNPAWRTPVKDRVMIETHFSLSDKQSSEFSGQAKAAVAAGAASVNGAISRTHSSGSQFKAVILSFQDRQQLIDDINKDSKALRALSNAKSPRVVGAIMRLESPGDFTDSGCLEGSAGASEATGTMSASASGKACNDMQASFSANTVIAYKLLKPVFNNAKSEIVSMHVKQPCARMDLTCGCNVFR